MLALIVAAKLVCEIALLCLVGQGVLAVVAGAGRERNFVYGLLNAATQPFVRAVRHITPRFVPVHHLPWVAFFWLTAAWVTVTLAKILWCVQIGVALCI
jgi:uncharacterized protein YggT (Ycf19 family)